MSHQLDKGIELYTQYIWEHSESRIEDPEFDLWCDQVINDYHAYMGRFNANSKRREIYVFFLG